MYVMYVKVCMLVGLYNCLLFACCLNLYVCLFVCLLVVV